MPIFEIRMRELSLRVAGISRSDPRPSDAGVGKSIENSSAA
jgi:hypothetical protein